jgi:transcriptional regulator with XRE-family HTH domain
MADLQQTIGTVIRRERQARGLTLKELASRSALSVVYMGELERGKKYPSGLVLERLAEALGLAMADLLELVAEELRGAEQPMPARAIGFTPPLRSAHAEPAPRAPIKGLLNLLVA